MSAVPRNRIIPLFEDFCKKTKVDGLKIKTNLCGKEVDLQLCSTPETLAKGYMDQDKPKEGEGMLFVYDDEDYLSFWMKNVKFPLDIIFFNRTGDYINHETMDPYTGEEDDDIPRYTSQKPARFAIELPAGWCEKNLNDKCKLSF